MTLLAAPALAATSTGETAMFWILAPVAVIGAVGTVMATRAVYSAMLLGMNALRGFDQVSIDFSDKILSLVPPKKKKEPDPA